MPPPLPARYRLEVRLGRDEDVEEWFATDADLNRPVLIRVLGPEATRERRDSFLESVRRASRVSHNHVAAVFAADRKGHFAYAVTEWTGGITLAHRIEAEDTPPVAEFLSNASGLADGLAALHGEGVAHGAIDPGAVLYPGAHPAKLAGFGRRLRTREASDDVQALGSALETALTGRPAGILAPSQVIDALPSGVDDALRLAQEAEVTARQLADLVRSIPYSPPLQPTSRWSWRWLVPAGVLALAAVVLVWLGNLLDADSSSPVLAPAIPSPTVTMPAATTAPAAAPTTTTPPHPVVMERAAAFDPLGDGQEHSSRIRYLTDGDPSTFWRTENYFDPLPLLKDGVGVVFEITGSPGLIELVGFSAGTTFRVMWAEQLLGIRDQGWETVTEERSGAANMRIPLPDRRDGVWLLWLIDLPPEGDVYIARLAEVSFLH